MNSRVFVCVICLFTTAKNFNSIQFVWFFCELLIAFTECLLFSLLKLDTFQWQLELAICLSLFLLHTLFISRLFTFYVICCCFLIFCYYQINYIIRRTWLMVCSLTSIFVFFVFVFSLSLLSFIQSCSVGFTDCLL